MIHSKCLEYPSKTHRIFQIRVKPVLRKSQPCVRSFVRPASTVRQRPLSGGVGGLVGVQRYTAPPRAPHAVYSRPDWRGASRPRDARPYARVRQVNLERTERCIQYRTLQKFTLIVIFGLIQLGGWKSDAEGSEAAVWQKMHFPTGARRRRCGPGGGCMRWWTSYWFLSGRSSLIVAVQGGIDRCTL